MTASPAKMYRTLLFAPGSRPELLEKAQSGAADALIFDLEDSVAHNAKDEARANVLEFDGDVLAGTVAQPIVDKSIKLRRLEELARERELELSQTMAVGDGANDLDMLRASGLGIAFHAKPAVAAAADARIEHGDLTALLYLQGYNEDEFVR